MAFEKFNVELGEYNKQIEEMNAKQGDNQQQERKEVPSGKYLVGLDTLELGATKRTGAPMIKMRLRIQEGEYNNYCIFINKVLVSEKNPSASIYFGCKLVNDLKPTTEIKYNGDFDDLGRQIQAVSDELCGKIQADIEYDKENYGNVTFTGVWDC